MYAWNKTTKLSAYLLENSGYTPEMPGQVKVKNRLYDNVMSHRDEITESDYQHGGVGVAR